MELNPVQFYHASNWDFPEGKTLTPAGARRSEVFYTDHLPSAHRYGTNVYKVTPETPGADRSRDFGSAKEYMTRSSLRVDGKVDPAAVQASVREHKRKKWGTQ
jgi:hypothetical protein